MTELLNRTDGVPGAVVTIDPRMAQVLAIDLLDEEPEPRTTLIDPRRFRQFRIVAAGVTEDGDRPAPTALGA